MNISSAPPVRAKTALLGSLAVLVLALGATSCAAPSKRVTDQSCQYCYRTESGILFKTWEAYDP